MWVSGWSSWDSLTVYVSFWVLRFSVSLCKSLWVSVSLCKFMWVWKYLSVSVFWDSLWVPVSLCETLWVRVSFWVLIFFVSFLSTVRLCEFWDSLTVYVSFWVLRFSVSLFECLWVFVSLLRVLCCESQWDNFLVIWGSVSIFHTVWIFQKFSITQILRQISFGDSKSAKCAIFTHLQPLNFEFEEILHLFNGWNLPN